MGSPSKLMEVLKINELLKVKVCLHLKGLGNLKTANMFQTRQVS